MAKKKLMRFEFKPYGGGEIERHSLLSLAYSLQHISITEHEFEKVVLGGLDEVIFVKDIGEFRRVQ